MFLSTPPSRVATWQALYSVGSSHVSIHATLAGGDRQGSAYDIRTKSFYPRHPRGWRHFEPHQERKPGCVSIHATLAGGDKSSGAILPPLIVFLSTPPSRVATAVAVVNRKSHPCFYPRHPRGWRQVKRRNTSTADFVSIHATLAGGDFFSTISLPFFLCFYPRHPRGWRRQKCTKMYSVFCAKRKKLSVKSKII